MVSSSQARVGLYEEFSSDTSFSSWCRSYFLLLRSLLRLSEPLIRILLYLCFLCYPWGPCSQNQSRNLIRCQQVRLTAMSFLYSRSLLRLFRWFVFWFSEGHITGKIPPECWCWRCFSMLGVFFDVFRCWGCFSMFFDVGNVYRCFRFFWILGIILDVLSAFECLTRDCHFSLFSDADACRCWPYFHNFTNYSWILW